MRQNASLNFPGHKDDLKHIFLIIVLWVVINFHSWIGSHIYTYVKRSPIFKGYVSISNLHMTRASTTWSPTQSYHQDGPYCRLSTAPDSEEAQARTCAKRLRTRAPFSWSGLSMVTLQLLRKWVYFLKCELCHLPSELKKIIYLYF